MCERYDPSPGTDAIAPGRLQRILEATGQPYILRDSDLVLAEHTLDKVRLVHDTLWQRLGRTPRLTDFEFVDSGPKGRVFIGYLRDTVTEITGRIPQDAELLDWLIAGPMTLLPKVCNKQRLSAEECTRLASFLNEFVQVLHERDAHC